MLRSMFSAISGLRASQTKMDVTGNNIANVNTVGFKGSSTVFQDTLSQVIRAGGAPAADRGGTNPAQVGLGVKVAGITTNWTQGATQSTGKSTDFMIEGDGFFVTQGTGSEQLFTRAGSFQLDGAGKLVTADGAVLQGWTAKADGTVDANGPIGGLSVPYGQQTNPKATTTGTITGNLPSEAKAGTVVQTKTVMYDAQGVGRDVVYTFSQPTPATPNQWNLTISTPDPTDPTKPPITLATTTVTYDPATSEMTAPAGGQVPFTPPSATFPAWPGPVTIDLSTVTQFGDTGEISAPTQDGYALGALQSFQLGADGTITGVYSNGVRQSIGRLALASFTNPGGLEKAGNSSFRVGVNSGVAQVGTAAQGGRGALVSGALEMSNVDLAEEFTGLIVAQRGFQANSRVITTSDQVLQELVNLKQ